MNGSCGHRVDAAVLGGACPICLLGLALGPPEIEGYEILDEIGQGGMGTVYRAKQAGAGMEVALKVIRDGEPANEIGNLVLLRHENIVRIYDGSGLSHDPAYFAMELIEGGTLADERWKQKFADPLDAAQLVAKIAAAVHHAHERLILHRDLKPANILMDKKGEPHVSDFSISKRVGFAAPAHTGTIAGSLGYMAPEQATGSETALTTSVDVYALGAILYELLTGRPPRQARSLDELRESFATEPTVPPRQLAGAVSGELEAVCLRALALDPDTRYRSAAGLAADLRRVASGGWPAWLPMTAGKRLARWTSAHRWTAATIAAGVALLVAVDASSYARIRAEETELVDVVLRTNAALAKAQAQAALPVLERFATNVMKAAEDPRLQSFLERPAVADRPADPQLDPPGCDMTFVLDCNGVARAHSVPDDVRRRAPEMDLRIAYAFRDYFRGASALGERGVRQAYISRALRSHWDQRFKFGIAAPIYRTTSTLEPCKAGTEWIGILLATRIVSSSLGQVQIADLGGSGHFTAIFGPRDRDRASDALPDTSTLEVVIHDRLSPGDERYLDRSLSQRLVSRFGLTTATTNQFEANDAEPYVVDGYVDPLWPPNTRLLGGFYPVGHTGFVVGVQTPYGKATSPVTRGYEVLLLNFGFAAFLVATLWTTLRKRANDG